jgi:hypothetical protein
MDKQKSSGLDRRRHPRYHVEVGNLVGFSSDGAEFEGVISDISFGGMRIRATEALPVIEGSFTLMHSAAGPLQVQQSWCKGSAMGVEFTITKDSDLVRSLRCVQILLNDKADTVEPES